MKKFLSVIIICLLASVTIQAQSVVINRVFKGTEGEGTVPRGRYDAIELLVVEDHVDMRNWIIKDYSSSVADGFVGDGGGKFRFKNVALWKNLRSGTTIVLRQPGKTATDNPSPDPNYVEDLDASDFKIDLNIRNTTYFRTLVSPNAVVPTGYIDRTFMLNDDSEIVLLRWDDGFGDGMGSTNPVHAFAYGNLTTGSHYTAITSPKLHTPTTPAKGAYAYAKMESNNISDFATVSGISKDKAPPTYNPPAANSESLAAKIQNNTTLVKSITSEEIRNNYPGVKEAYITYVTPADKNITLHILDIDLSDPKLTIEVGTRNDAFSSGGAQTVVDMIPYKNNNSFEKQVIAGINGDYFSYTNGAFIANASVIKDGIIVRDNMSTGYKHFGQLDDKTYQIGDYTDYSRTKLRFNELIGGKTALVWNGVLTNADDGSGVRARTSIGLVNDKRVIMLVVDEAHANSSGYSLPHLGQVMKALGSVNAVNLDGGGSSVFVVRELNGQYKTKNIPNSNPQRAVSNALLLMRRTD